MKTFKYINLPLIILLLSLISCKKDEDATPDDKRLKGDWILDTIYEEGENITYQFRDINNWVDASYLWIDEDVADIKGPYFQCFVVGFFAEGADANHNEGKWDVKNDVLLLDGYSGKLEARINKISSDELYLEVNENGRKLEYRFYK